MLFHANNDEFSQHVVNERAMKPHVIKGKSKPYSQFSGYWRMQPNLNVEFRRPAARGNSDQNKCVQFIACPWITVGISLQPYADFLPFSSFYRKSILLAYRDVPSGEK